MSSPQSSPPAQLYTGATPARPPRAISSQIIQTVAMLVLLALLGISGVQIYHQIAANDATAAYSYSVAVPGQHCTDLGIGIWNNVSAGKVPSTITCQGDRLAVTMPYANGALTEVQFAGERGKVFPMHYRVSVVVNVGTSNHVCAGLLVHPDQNQHSDALYLCGNNEWFFAQYSAAHTVVGSNPPVVDRGIGTEATLSVQDRGAEIDYLIDSTVVFTQQMAAPLQSQPYVSLVMYVNQASSKPVAASFRDFSFIPQV
jgi:hypothetical protein